MTKRSEEITDKDIIQWLAPSVCFHEKVATEDINKAKCSCGKWEGDVRSLSTHQSRMGVQQTLTLEFMLEKIYEKNLNFEFDPPDYTGKEKRCITIYNEEKDDYYLGEGQTLSLALRGVICKLMEEEVKCVGG